MSNSGKYIVKRIDGAGEVANGGAQKNSLWIVAVKTLTEHKMIDDVEIRQFEYITGMKGSTLSDDQLHSGF